MVINLITALLNLEGRNIRLLNKNQKLNLRSKHHVLSEFKILTIQNDHNNTSSLISSKRNLDLIEDNDEEDRSITPDPIKQILLSP